MGVVVVLGCFVLVFMILFGLAGHGATGQIGTSGSAAVLLHGCCSTAVPQLLCYWSAAVRSTNPPLFGESHDPGAIVEIRSPHNASAKTQNQGKTKETRQCNPMRIASNTYLSFYFFV